MSDQLRYVILSKDEAESIDFSTIRIRNVDYLWWSNDGSKTFVKFSGDTPSWLEGKTILSRKQIGEILFTPDSGWLPEIEDA